jgi:hypothetical protein
MAQGDLNVANQSGAAFRADLNNQLAALGTLQSGASAPSTTFAYQWWADTTTGLLKIRNAANNAWITVGTLASTNLGLVPSSQTATTSAAGIVQLTDSTSSTSTTTAATPNAVKTAFDLATAALPKAELLAGTRNRVINGDMRINQRGATSISAVLGTGPYFVDRWFGFATGAATTLSRSTLTGALPNGFRVTGAAGNTLALIAHRIESLNSADLAGQSVTLSFWAASSGSVTLTWRVSYANALDNFNPVTQSNAGTVSTTTGLTRYTATFTLSASATTGVQIEISAANFTSGTFDITGVQLEPGTVATPFERRSYGLELALCQRYYQKTSSAYVVTDSGTYQVKFHPVSMRATPTVSGGGAGYSYSGDGNVLAETQTARALQNITYSAEL